MTRTDSSEAILIADFDFGDVDIERAIIEGAGLQLLAAQCKSEDEVIEAGRETVGILTQYARVGSRAIDALTRCRVIARYGTGVDIVDVDAATQRGIQVTAAPNEWCAEEVADHAVALWLAAARKICQYDRATRQGEWHWKTGRPIHRLRGQVLGLLSFGSIARLIAERAKAFGVEVWAHDPFLDQSEIRAYQVRPMSFDDLVENADYVVVQTPLTPQTHHTFDRATLRRMKPSAILINTARGPIVEDAAIHQALDEGWIAGAALDDIEEEPAKQRGWRPSNPLLRLPNAIVTPHAAYYSEEAVRTVRTIAAEEAVPILSGQPARFPVNELAGSHPHQCASPPHGS
ncbi:C-terminal binding protein [Streptomyces malaysiensis]|uniref:C-terminal binding protein n=1 Tax=Streptomyces malaysiensis TaxID=92644 RepID=UPI0036AE4420